MKKKLSVFLIIALMIFAFTPALTLAQDDVQNGLDEEDLEEDQETVDDEDQEIEEISDELRKVLEADYDSVKEFLTALEKNELLSTVEKITLKEKLNSYDENLSMESITSVVDRVLTEEIDLGQGFVILNNLEESIANGYEEEKALELINSYQDQENSGQFAFQTALELRKLSREDRNGEMTEEFAEEISSIIEEEGSIETSELKQLAAEYRKKAREEEREERKNIERGKSDSASENALENGKANNGEKGKGNKGEGSESNGKGNSNKGNGSSNSNANENAKN